MIETLIRKTNRRTHLPFPPQKKNPNRDAAEKKSKKKRRTISAESRRHFYESDGLKDKEMQQMATIEGDIKLYNGHVSRSAN